MPTTRRPPRCCAPARSANGWGGDSSTPAIFRAESAAGSTRIAPIVGTCSSNATATSSSDSVSERTDAVPPAAGGFQAFGRSILAVARAGPAAGGNVRLFHIRPAGACRDRRRRVPRSGGRRGAPRHDSVREGLRPSHVVGGKPARAGGQPARGRRVGHERGGNDAGPHAADRARARRARHAGGALRAGVQRTRHCGDHRPPPADAHVRFTSDAAAARSRDAADSGAALHMVLTTTPVSPPGTRMVYSDLNAILLGEIVRRVTGVPLDAFVTRELYAPLGLERDMLFRPSRRLEPRTAPTGLWHGHPIAAVVNDPSAGMLGGVSGNAGVFATAQGLACFAQFMLNEGALGSRRIIRVETVRRFVQIAVPARRGVSARTLGWEALPTGEEPSGAGSLFGPHSYGHTGWTGTSLWIDPDRDIFVLLLTNRAFNPRTSKSFTKLKQVRGHIADAAARASDQLVHASPTR